MSATECLHQAFEARSRAAADRIAVSTADEQVTYRELDIRANRLAQRLRDMGVGPDKLVGLCAERSVELIVGMLGILKAGGAYVPIDPGHPARRIEFIGADSAISIVVATAGASASLSGCNAAVVPIDTGAAAAGDGAAAVPPTAVAGHHLAYVIYTSGSTGVPKGVLVEHRNVMRLFESTRDRFGFAERDVWTLFHSASFDFSVWEIWGALLHGGRLVIVPPAAIRFGTEFHALLRREKVTILNQTPSAFRQLLAADVLEQPSCLALRIIVFGGEVLDVKLLEPWIARHGDEAPALVNMYGITEITVHATYRRIRESDLARPEVSPIGAPLLDLEIHLVDEAGQAVPDGSAGEIQVVGAGLARGYLRRPELTAERFIASASGQRLYRSGDRAVRLPDGELAYLGRCDDQIKVRGFRIEPREIELCLSAHPKVSAAVIVPRDFGDGDVRLLAYVVPRLNGQPFDQLAASISADLNDRAAAELDAHMRPSAYRLIAELPLNPNGKVDRNALRQMPLPGPVSTGEEPISTTERAIRDICEEVLQCQGLGAHDDFFDRGATSLAFIRMLQRVNQQFGLSLNGSELGGEATIAQLVACVAAGPGGGQTISHRGEHP